MRVLLVTPAPPRARSGNRVTAVRWARLLRDLGHRVSIAQEFDQQKCDLLVALHARKSANSVFRFAKRRPDNAVVVALTGTDLYHDLSHNWTAQSCLDFAQWLVVLQPDAIRFLPPSCQGKAKVILQSVRRPSSRPRRLQSRFEVSVVGHLRKVKDPFRAALAARRLPTSSRIEIVHVGAALSASMSRRAIAETRKNPRYRWLGELTHGQTMTRLARSRLMVLSSLSEGGANVLSEAITCGVPVLSSRISGSIGLLGEQYPGFFDYGDTVALTELLARCEADRSYLNLLTEWCNGLAPRFSPACERAAWDKLLRELRINE